MKATTYTSSCLLLVSPLSPASSLQPEKLQRGLSRRDLFNGALLPASVAVMLSTSSPHEANAIYNPLNLKGTFWETGELYVKKVNELPADPDDLLPLLRDAFRTLEGLDSYVLDGKFDDLSRQLRGGSISESQLRLRGYALLDQLPEESKDTYLAEQAFRVFLTRFVNLDATVEAAARQAKIDGGLVEALALTVVAPLGAANEVAKIAQEPSMAGDARITVLASLGGTTKAFQAFLKASGDALTKKDEGDDAKKI
jgi:hypothetical protein